MKTLQTKYKYCYYEKDENIIHVLTPVPYEIDCDKRSDLQTAEQIANTVFMLNESCLFLYNVLKLLNISIAEAREMHYSLNYETGDKLKSIAYQKRTKHNSISHEVFKMISNYDW